MSKPGRTTPSTRRRLVAATRFERVMWMTLFAILAFFFIAPVVLAFPSTARLFNWLVGLGGIALISFALLMNAARRASRRILERHAWMLCSSCAFPLDALPDAEQCPECGAPFDHHETVAAWRTRYP